MKTLAACLRGAALLGLLAAPALAAGVIELTATLDGEVVAEVEGYRKGDDVYVSARGLAKAYGGRLRWLNGDLLLLRLQ